MPKRRYKPGELFEKYRLIRVATSDEDFFNRPEHQRTQELWCAAHFANAYDKYLAPCVVLIDESTTDTDTDFDLETAGRMFPFQVSEVQEPGRRRGDEYKQPQYLRPEHDLSRGSVLAPQWVREGIQKKVAKRYAKCTNFESPDLPELPSMGTAVPRHPERLLRSGRDVCFDMASKRQHDVCHKGKPRSPYVRGLDGYSGKRVAR